MGHGALKPHPIDSRLRELAIELPPRTRPAGNYHPSKHHGNTLYLSGQFPIDNGVLRYPGVLGEALSKDEGYAAARLAALNALAHIRAASDGWRRFKTIIRLDGYIASAQGWLEQPQVLDGASDLFVALLGAQGEHARSVLACAQLPMNAAVELVLTVGLT
ncbi:MAG TPA: RidA family protein [Gammaproteobacteria bacterium]|nr:RidA family protein [Gammaproteobacteria bacterium]